MSVLSQSLSKIQFSSFKFGIVLPLQLSCLCSFFRLFSVAVINDCSIYKCTFPIAEVLIKLFKKDFMCGILHLYYFIHNR